MGQERGSIKSAADEAEARGQYTGLVPVMERVLFPEHRDTLDARASPADRECGDAVGARDQFMALVRVMARVFGPDYRETLDARHNLAYQTGQAGSGDSRGLNCLYSPRRGGVLGAWFPLLTGGFVSGGCWPRGPMVCL